MIPSSYAHLANPLISSEITPPKNDKEAIDLVNNSKAALDHQTALHKGAHPAVQDVFEKQKQAHIDHVALAMHRYHRASPTAISTRIVDAMHSDPTLKITHKKP